MVDPRGGSIDRKTFMSKVEVVDSEDAHDTHVVGDNLSLFLCSFAEVTRIHEIHAAGVHQSPDVRCMDVEFVECLLLPLFELVVGVPGKMEFVVVYLEERLLGDDARAAWD